MKDHYRHDIQGIRAIGAILILIYHIWGSKVSGGVDVFFVVSGFLMTGLLLRQHARDGKLKPFRFWANIVKRVAPAAYLVLFATFVCGYFFLPPLFWLVTINELLFSAVHLENIQLMRRAVDYLATDNPASPFQQFWALSMQVQFYVLLPLLLAPGIFLLKRGRSPVWVIGLVFVVSFIYSIVVTHTAPNSSYFNTGARLWEFLAGAMVAMLLPRVRLSERLASGSAIAGLSILAGTGLLVPGQMNFPGFVALLPVTGAVLLLLAGADTRQQPWASRLLSHRFLVMIGGVSFSIYLWHWPILVYTQHHFATTELSGLQGSAVIAAATALAFLTTRIIENPFRRLPSSRLWPAYLVGFLCFVPVAFPGVGARQYVLSFYDHLEGNPSPLRYFTGRQIDLQDNATGVTLTQFATADSNKSFTFFECLDGRLCESGDTNAQRTVALVGGSHAAHWEPAFSAIGKRYGFKLVTIVQESCALGYLAWMDDTCRDYNERIVPILQSLDPEFVVTTATRLGRHAHSTEIEHVPRAYVDKWRDITALGIPLLGIRDNPWFEEDPALCVWNNVDAAERCARPVNELYLKANPADRYEYSLPLFHSVDFKSFFCTREHCPAIVDNYLMYWDTHHFTKTYMDYIAMAVMRSLERQAPLFPKRTKCKPPNRYPCTQVASTPPPH